MSEMVVDLCPVDRDDFAMLKKLVGERLVDVKIDGSFVMGDLLLIFEKHILRVSMQDSDEYGTNVFWWLEGG